MVKKILSSAIFLGLSSHALAGYATFSVHGDNQGASVTVYSGNSVNSTKAQYGSDFHDTITSVKVVGSSTCVAAFEHSGFEGKRVFLGPGNHHLSDYGLNDEITSMHVIDSYNCNESAFSEIFRHADFVGPVITVPIGYTATKLNGAELWYRDYNDDFSSVRVGANACVRLYRHGGLSGDFIDVKSDVSGLGSFNDEASSFVVLNASECSGSTGGTGGSGGSGGGSGGPINQN